MNDVCETAFDFGWSASTWEASEENFPQLLSETEDLGNQVMDLLKANLSETRQLPAVSNDNPPNCHCQFGSRRNRESRRYPAFHFINLASGYTFTSPTTILARPWQGDGASIRRAFSDIHASDMVQ